MTIALHRSRRPGPASSPSPATWPNRRILEAGCGSGPLFAALRDRGAIVTGIDASTKMLELARRRLEADASLHLADLRSRLPFTDGAFDDVVASLALHYLEEWRPTLVELRRVLRLGGRLIGSTHHPFVDFAMVRGLVGSPNQWGIEADPETDFPDHQLQRELDPRRANLPDELLAEAAACDDRRLHRRRLPLAVISEPQPEPAARDLFPDDFHHLATGPSFLFFVVEAS